MNKNTAALTLTLGAAVVSSNAFSTVVRDERPVDKDKQTFGLHAPTPVKLSSSEALATVQTAKPDPRYIRKQLALGIVSAQA